MRVNSALANMNMYIGQVDVRQKHLLIESDDSSSIPAEVFVNHDDVRRFLKAVLKSPRALLWIMLSPFKALFAKQPTETIAATSRQHDPVNKPW